MGNNKALKENSDALNQNTDKNKENSEAMSGGLMKLFVFQSAISMANGPLEEIAKNGNGVAQTFGKLGLATSNVAASFIQQKMLLSELTESFGVKNTVGLKGAVKGAAVGAK